jgi:two-component system NtrC family sensor kinase
MPGGGKLRAHSARLDDEVAVSVSDTGRGIPAEIRDRIFALFFITKPGGEGTALGLSISLGIVQEHNGEIIVEKPGRARQHVHGVAASGACRH